MCTCNNVDAFFSPYILFLPFSSLFSPLVVSQIRGHLAGSSTPYDSCLYFYREKTPASPHHSYATRAGRHFSPQGSEVESQDGAWIVHSSPSEGLNTSVELFYRPKPTQFIHRKCEKRRPLLPALDNAFRVLVTSWAT